MFKGSKKVVAILTVLCISIPVKAETVIEIKIPEEIKKEKTCLCTCKECVKNRIGDFEDYTETKKDYTGSEKDYTGSDPKPGIENTDPKTLPLQQGEVIQESDNIMLQKIAIAESGGTDVVLMAYIMQVVLNRVNSSEFPDTISEVITQKKQFSTYPNKYNNSVPNEHSKKALDSVDQIINQDQLFFENTTIGSWQSTHLTPVFEYSGLSFYK